jgi:hypothetical protein
MRLASLRELARATVNRPVIRFAEHYDLVTPSAALSHLPYERLQDPARDPFFGVHTAVQNAVRKALIQYIPPTSRVDVDEPEVGVANKVESD